MGTLKEFKVEMKEVGNSHILKQTAFVSSREEVIKIYGLKEPDIEWYKITEVQTVGHDNGCPDYSSLG